MSQSSASAFNAAQIAALRRRLKEVEPAARKELDKDLRSIARVAALEAAGLEPHLTGRLAAGWKASLTYGRGAAIVNRVEYAGQHEYGSRIWLRQGFPYRDENHTPPAGARRNGLEIRQVSAGNGLVVNEARYLIRRSQAGNRAVLARLAESAPLLEAALARAADRAL